MRRVVLNLLSAFALLWLILITLFVPVLWSFSDEPGEPAGADDAAFIFVAWCIFAAPAIIVIALAGRAFIKARREARAIPGRGFEIIPPQ